MIHDEYAMLARNENWVRVLECYRERQELQLAADPEASPWLRRVTSVDDIDDAWLPRIHGKLIALGFLKFQISSRVAGVEYQVSPSGNRALSHLSSGQPDEAGLSFDNDSDDEQAEAA